MLQKFGLTLFIVFIFSTAAFPQKVKELKISGGCNYYGESLDSDVYTFESDQEAIDAVDNILNPVGLVRNFDIRAADVPNAAAVILPGDSTRYLLYNQAFMRRVKDATRTDWAAISIMAHEIGHHLNGHTLIPGGSRPKLELEADNFSGFVLYKMGATLEEAEAAMNAIASEKGSATHPAKRSRLTAIEAGWTKAKDQDTSSRKTDKSRETPKSETLDLSGNWEGTYFCGQGLTNLNLVISQDSSSQISAIFNFYASRSNPSVPSGSYRMAGTYDNRTNKITLRATNWIKQPFGYYTVDLAGKVSQNNIKISGEVLDSACSTFEVERK